MELDAVLSAGGVKGIALIGALSVFEAEGYTFIRHAGTSAGAIVGGLHAAGYSGDEMREEWMSVNFRRGLMTEDQTEAERELETVDERGDGESASESLGEWAFRSRADSDLERRVISTKRLGLFPSTGFAAILRKLLERKGVRTFRDLRLFARPGAQPRYRITMVGADVTRGRLILLPYDIIHYEGFDSPDDLDVTLAMRISMSIPAVFRPVALRQKGTGRVCYLVDGGILSQFPIAFFETRDVAPRPAIGFRLHKPENSDSGVRITGMMSLLTACALTAIEAHDAQLADLENWATRTVRISGLDISEINFVLSADQKERLYNEGVSAARAFLSNPESRAYMDHRPGLGYGI
jgi:NTE family protein